MLQAPLASSRSHPRIGRFSEAPWFLVLRRVGLAPSVWVPSVRAVTQVSLLLALSRGKTGTLCVNTSSLCGHTPGDDPHVSPSTLTASSARVHADVPGSAPARVAPLPSPAPAPVLICSPPLPHPSPTSFFIYSRFCKCSGSEWLALARRQAWETILPARVQCHVRFLLSAVLQLPRTSRVTLATLDHTFPPSPPSVRSSSLRNPVRFFATVCIPSWDYPPNP